MTVDPAPYTRDYHSGRTTPPAASRDLVFTIAVPSGNGVTVEVVPQAGLDVGLGESSFSQCPEMSQFANLGGAGAREVVAWNNLGGGTVNGYFIVHAWGTGSFTITATLNASVITCGPSTCGHGCCMGNTCQQGDTEIGVGCGSGGAVCSICGSGQRCRNNVCMQESGTTGGVCTADAQCYEPVVGTRDCAYDWPSGGYCRSTCFVVGSGCGGVSAPGFCVNSECLAKCNSPGTGRSNCAAGYLCDYSDPLVTTSQGVCVPECGLVACSTWSAFGSCQPNGLCR